MGAGPAILGGASVLDAISNRNSSRRAADAANSLSEPARMLFQQTDPLRQLLIDRSTNFLEGGLDVTQSPEFGAFKNALEGQYNVARDNIISSAPSGGALTNALTNLEASRAGDFAQGVGSLAGNETNRAFSLATGSPLTSSLGGLSGAANIQAQLLNSQAARSSAAKQGLGYGAGQILGNKPPGGG